MTYFEFLNIVWPIKNRGTWKFKTPLSFANNRGRWIYLDNDGSVVLSVDIGDDIGVEITHTDVDEHVVVKEVFENYINQY